MSRYSSRSRENERGQAIVIIAFAMVGLLAFVALAIDGGNTLTERRRAQNAADAGALAGARTIIVQLANGIEFEEPVLRAINAAAEANGVDDSDGNPPNGNHINTNVHAYYTNRDGTPLAGNPEVGAFGAIPSGAQGIRVVADRHFRAFIAGLIGRPNLDANAEAIAVIIPPTGCGDFAIYAGCSDCDPNTVHISGAGPTINGGGIHSNGEVHINNTTIENGMIEYATQCTPSGQCDATGSPVTQAAATAFPVLWEIEDFRPGGSEAQWAVANGVPYYSFSGNIRDNDLQGDGLYYTTGDIDLHDPVCPRCTFVAEGEIQISGGANIHTYKQEWPLLFSNSPNSAQGAIKVSGDNASWTGFLYAPNGLVSMSNASNSTLSGAIYGKEVKLTGANIYIHYDPAYCPPQRSRVVLLK